MSAATVRVALADDQALVRAGLRALLQGLGVQVVLEADDGQALLDGLAHQPVDVVLSDIRMPGLDGIQALQQRVRQHVALAQQFAAWVAADADFELAAPVPLNLVCFRHRGGDAVNQRIMDHLNRSGRMFLSHTRLADQLTLRMSIAQTDTELPPSGPRPWVASKRSFGPVALMR